MAQVNYGTGSIRKFRAHFQAMIKIITSHTTSCLKNTLNLWKSLGDDRESLLLLPSPHKYNRLLYWQRCHTVACVVQVRLSPAHSAPERVTARECLLLLPSPHKAGMAHSDCTQLCHVDYTWLCHVEHMSQSNTLVLCLKVDIAEY